MLFDILFFGTAFLVIGVSYYVLFVRNKKKKAVRRVPATEVQTVEEGRERGESGEEEEEDENQLQKTKKQMYRDAKKQEKQ